MAKESVPCQSIKSLGMQCSCLFDVCVCVFFNLLDRVDISYK